MENFFLKSKLNQDYSIAVPEGNVSKVKQRGYFFAFAKSGSTLLDRMVTEYCKEIEVPTLSLFGQAFGQGVNPINVMEDAKQCVEAPGIIYTGFRHYPMNFDIDLNDSKLMLLVRDPRDMLVSLYYSIAKSHVKLKGDSNFDKVRKSTNLMTVDHFALEKAKIYVHNFERYKDSFANKDVLISRYEDVIYEKEIWLAQIVKHFSLDFDEGAIKRIVEVHDIIPASEEQNSHVRQVHPGNYKEKLRLETIEKLNSILIDFLNEYSY